MAESTAESMEVSRDEAADLLQELARELRGQGDADVAVGNKTVRLSPPSAVTYAIETDERSPMLGGDEQSVTVTLGWETEDE
ncbi:amphi-Trp domain-containing protein [Natronorarus salvus]|uniref:amphi-Trp domain-containing protein n=1 Tax=Natronorarus salvus TaxID=3117733 RepID=UPI002F26593C